MICKIEIANYIFLFCKSCEHISISLITDFHFVSFRFANYSKLYRLQVVVVGGRCWHLVLKALLKSFIV